MALKTMIISNLLLLISCVEYLSSRFEFEGKRSSNFAIQQNSCEFHLDEGHVQLNI